MPRVLPIDSQSPQQEIIADAALLLRAGGLVAFPTETVYGLGARLFDEQALARVFAAKGRPASHPLIAHVSGIEQARTLVADWDARAEVLARAFWPGPLTLVLPRSARVPAAATGGGPTLAMRAPAHPVAHALIDALGEPIAAPSANRYQTLSPTRAAHVLKSLGDAVELILDGGACSAGIESTVVDLSAGAPRVLRPGAIGIAALRARLPDLVISQALVEADAPHPAPGMDAKHYAPRALLMVVDGRGAAVARWQEMVDAGESRAALVLRGGAAPDDPLVHVLPADPEGYASLLFAALHALDDAGAAVIVVEAVPDEEPWLAVRDRLTRACG
jgi:L-threonylcarbamoyladenylate synthase